MMQTTAERNFTHAVAVIGGGGHARVVIDALLASGAQLLGIVVRTPPSQGQTGPFDLPVIGDDAALLARGPAEILLANGVGGTGNTGPRRIVYERFAGEGFRFATVIHPSATIGRDVRIGEGSQIMAGAVLQTGCMIGSNCIVNTGARIDHDCHVGSHVHIAPGAVLCGDVTVEDGAHVGAGAVIRQSVTVGSAAVIGLGAAVIADVAAALTVVGVPARVLPK